MKKLIPFVAVALLATMFTSCKKDYKCTCTQTVTGSDPIVTTVDLGKAKKKDAESACSAKSTASSGGVTASITCKLD